MKDLIDHLLTIVSALLPFRPALLEAAVGLEVPVHYATLHYATTTGGTPSLLAWSVCRLPVPTRHMRIVRDLVATGTRSA